MYVKKIFFEINKYTNVEKCIIYIDKVIHLISKEINMSYIYNIWEYMFI